MLANKSSDTAVCALSLSCLGKVRLLDIGSSLKQVLPLAILETVERCAGPNS